MGILSTWEVKGLKEKLGYYYSRVDVQLSNTRLDIQKFERANGIWIYLLSQEFLADIAPMRFRKSTETQTAGLHPSDRRHYSLRRS